MATQASTISTEVMMEGESDSFTNLKAGIPAFTEVMMEGETDSFTNLESGILAFTQGTHEPVNNQEFLRGYWTQKKREQ